MKTFMLLLAFTVIDPDGVKMDEEVHILSRHFDDQQECKNFVVNCGDVIRPVYNTQLTLPTIYSE